MREIDVSLPVLDLMASRLAAAAQDLDEIGASAPTSVDAGELTGPLLAALERALGVGLGLAEGCAVLGEKIAASAREYRERDELVAEDLTRLARERGLTP